MPLGFGLVAYDRLGSTNEEARRLAMVGAVDGTLVWAGEQTAGRGRGQRSWVSVPGNLYFSLLLRPEEPPGQAAQLTFVAANAIARAVAAALPPGAAPVTCKWPNDILVGGRKVAGILLEAEVARDGKLAWLVIGAGVNITGHPPEVLYPTTALREEGAATATAVSMLGACGHELLAGVAEWRREGFDGVRERWLARAHGLGAMVTVRLEHTTLNGVFVGLDRDGAMILEQDGGERRIAAGDVFFAAA